MAGGRFGDEPVDFDDHDTVIVFDAVEATRHFESNRRGPAVLMSVVLGLFVLLIVLTLALAVPRPIGPKAIGPLVLLGSLALLALAGLAVYLPRALRFGTVLSLTADGIESPQLRAPVAWSELDDVEFSQANGYGTLLLRLREPHPVHWTDFFLLRHDPRLQRLSMATLRRSDQQAAFGEIHARLAERRHAQGLGEAPSMAQARVEQALQGELDARTPVPWALYTVVALNAAVWLLTLSAGLSATSPLPAQLFQWGANSAWAVVNDHEYWRLLSATLLHAGLLHLALNLFALWQAGRQVCRWYGNANFLLVYVGAALVGSSLSLHYSAQQLVSVGASGAVFGVLGAFVVIIWRHRGRFPSARATSLLLSQGLFLLYMLSQGFTQRGIDNAAHIGGLIAGALLAAWLPQTVDTDMSRRGRLARQGVGTLAALALVAALVATTPSPAFNPRQIFKVQADLARLNPRLQAAALALQADLKHVADGKLTQAQLLRQVEQRHIPAYQLNNRLLEPLVLPTTTQEGRWLADFKRHNQLMSEVLVLELRKSRGDPDVADINRQAAAANAELKVLAGRLNAAAARKQADGASAPF